MPTYIGINILILTFTFTRPRTIAPPHAPPQPSYVSNAKKQNDLLEIDTELQRQIDFAVPRPAAAQSLPPHRCVRGGRHAADTLGYEAILPPQQVEARRCRFRDYAAAPRGDQHTACR